MNDSNNTISLSIMGKQYKVKCPLDRIQELRESAQYLEDKMRGLAQGGKIVGTDKLAVIAALNIAFELLVQKKQATSYVDTMNRSIQELQNKIDESLASAT